MYPNPQVAEFVANHFIPVRVHVRDNAEAFEQFGQRFDAQWTPTTLIVDSEGHERHRVEGFLPVTDFLAQLRLGLAHSMFGRGRFAEAEPLFREVTETHPETESAAEAVYWAGVSRYKATNDAGALRDTARAFAEKYRDSTWAKRASVWR